MSRNVSYIVIADRNRHVREFLRREFLKDGYRVQLARDGFDLINILRAEDRPDLIVLDLDLPYMAGFVLQEILFRQNSGLPIIIHGMTEENENNPLIKGAKYQLEKSGNPGGLKEAVSQVLRECHCLKNKDLS